MFKSIIVSILSLLLLDSADNIADQTSIMKHIEANVQLPEGAESIGDYSRNYAILPNKKIKAVYIIPFKSNSDGDEEVSCSVVVTILEFRPCTEEENKEYRENEREFLSMQGKAGESRWLDDHTSLPGLLDGGCSFIEIIFNPKSNIFESINCNGYA